MFEYDNYKNQNEDDEEVKIELFSDQLVADTGVFHPPCMPTSSAITAILTLLILMWTFWFGFVWYHNSKKRQWKKVVDELSRKKANEEESEQSTEGFMLWDPTANNISLAIKRQWTHDGNWWIRLPIEGSAKDLAEAKLDFITLMMNKLDQIGRQTKWKSIQTGDLDEEEPPIGRLKMDLEKEGSPHRFVGNVFLAKDPPPFISLHTFFRALKHLGKQLSVQVVWLAVYGLAYSHKKSFGF